MLSNFVEHLDGSEVRAQKDKSSVSGAAPSLEYLSAADDIDFKVAHLQAAIDMLHALTARERRRRASRVPPFDATKGWAFYLLLSLFSAMLPRWDCSWYLLGSNATTTVFYRYYVLQHRRIFSLISPSSTS